MGQLSRDRNTLMYCATVDRTHPLIPPHTGTLALDCDCGGTRLRYCTIRNRKKEAATAMIKEDTIM